MRVNLIVFCANAAVIGTWFFLPIYARDNLGLSELDIGLLFGAYGIATLLSSYFFGILSDRVGRKTFLYLGFVFSMITFGLHAVTWDFWSLLTIRILAGFAVGIYPAALVAYVYEAKKKMGKFSSFGSIGFGFGGFVAGLLAEEGGIRIVFVLSALMLGISLLLAMRLPHVESIKQKIPFFPLAVIKKNKMVYISFLLRHSGAHSIWVIFPLYLIELEANLFWIGVIHAINAISQFVCMFFITDKYSSRNQITAGLLLSVLIFFLFSNATVWWQFLPLQVILGMSWAFLYVGSLKYVTEKNIEKATATGMLNSILSLSIIFGAFMGGTVGYYYGKKWTIIVAFVLSLLGTLLWFVFEIKEWKMKPSHSEIAK